MGMTRAPLNNVTNMAADAEFLAKVTYVAENYVKTIRAPRKPYIPVVWARDPRLLIRHAALADAPREQTAASKKKS